MNVLEGEAFFEGLDEFICSTDCDLIKPEAQIGDFVTSRLSCNRTTAQCRLVEFLSQREQELESIEHAIRNLPKKERDSRVLQALGRIRNDKTAALGEQNCWALGDVIIALSVPDDVFIYTIDHHFEVICQALGKKLFVEGR